MNLKPYLSWCAAQGIVSPLDVRVRSTDGYRYTVWKDDENRQKQICLDDNFLIAHDNDDFDDDDDKGNNKVTLIQCPLSSCLQAKSGLELAERLSYEASLGDGSLFAPYIRVLPGLASFQHALPRFWSERRLEGVKDGGFLRMAIKDDEDRVEKAKDFQWALACVDSRANNLPDGAYSLTPFLDMINHDVTVATTARLIVDDDDDTLLCLDVAKESLSLLLPAPQPSVSSSSPSKSALLFGSSLFRNKQPTKKGQPREVCISYGQLSNLQTLVNYGFVQRDNPCNSEFIRINLMQRPSPVIVEVQAKYGSLDPFSVGTLRWNLATSKEKEAMSDNIGPMVPFRCDFLSERNEMETYAVIAGFLEESIYDAKVGAENAGRNKHDTIVRDYLEERQTTLTNALEKIRKRFPDILLE